MTREKIAVLGGGMSALTAAFELTRTPALRERYEVTVYQMGHRLGGKGASGRNRARADRIEEHGLHVLMGWYHNAFEIMRACYDELGRPPSARLATVEEAFEPHQLVVVMDRGGGRWEPWPLRFPPLPGAPGKDGVDLPSPAGYLRQILDWLRRLFADTPETQALAPLLGEGLREIDRKLGVGLRPRGEPTDPDEERRRLERLVDDLQRLRPRGEAPSPATFLDLSYRLSRFDAADPWARLTWLVRRFKAWLWEKIAASIEASTPLRRLWICFDLGLTTVLGLVADGLVGTPNDWTALDDVDLQAWLDAHGAAPITRDSALVRSLYNLAFSAPGQISAGTAILGVMRMCFSYRGSIFYKMRAGMGDVVFAPLYLVLERRGVRFEFFHRVDRLVLSSDKTSIAAVEMRREATPKGGAYDPLFDLDGLPCWPSEPRYEALEEGEALRTRSGPGGATDVGRRRLVAGADYDAVVLGISIGAFPAICKELIDAGGPFARMVEHVRTTQTQALQLWLRPPLAELGWTLEPPVLDGFAAPFDTWADMTHLLPEERWPEGHRPASLFYLCTRLEDAPAPGEDPEDRVRANAVAWLNESAGALWPRAVTPGGFDWSLLVDPEERSGVARLEAQYVEGSEDASDRYVLAVPGSGRYRLRADESGFDNLILAGDWVRTGLSVGCLEAATMAGKQAARALSGSPAVIPGDLPAPSAPRALRAAGGLPRYLERGGDLVIRQALRMQRTTSYSFVLPARVDRLAALCDRLLNAPARGAVEYVPAGPFVTLVCADIARGQSRDVPDRDRGWLPERDVAFWVPVLAGTRAGGAFVPLRLVWFLPYAFVDNAAAVVTGREVFGFPKQSGTLLFPSDPGSGGAFSVDALLIRTQGVESRAGVGRLLTVVPAEPGPLLDPTHAPATLAETIRAHGAALVEHAYRGAAPGVLAAADVITHLARGFLDMAVPMVFLKQFRDVADPSRACYRAVVEAPAVLDRWYGGGPLPAHRVLVEPADSHPFVDDLGLPGREIESLTATWMKYDFTMESGAVIRSEP